jgi:hypothetical protein
VKQCFKPKNKNLKAYERIHIPLENFLKDKIHQIYPLEKFPKDNINKIDPLKNF